MLMTPAASVQDRENRSLAHLSELISAIGDSGFDSKLIQSLNETCGAEHVAVYTLDSERMLGLITASIDGNKENYELMSRYAREEWWRYDPIYDEARAKLCSSTLVAVPSDLEHLGDARLRDFVYARRGIKGRVFCCARLEEVTVGFALCASTQAFSCEEHLAEIEASTAPLFAAVAKHIELQVKHSNVSVALTSLDQIERCIAEQMPEMPRREAQVCSRAIYGVTTLGIALELEISHETVMTYRKRAYSRLGIATQRELLIWYLQIWSGWSGRGKVERLH